MGTHMRVLNESFSMNTKITGFRWFLFFCILVLWTKVASALEGLALLLLMLLSSSVQKNQKYHLNPVMLVFIGKLSLSTIR